MAIHRVNTAAELGDMQTVLDSTVSLNIATLPVEPPGKPSVELGKLAQRVNVADAV